MTKKKTWNQRKKAVALLVLSALFLTGIVLAGFLLREAALETDFSRKNLPPSLRHPFGTDWLGRNMFVRTLSGLSTSILLGLLTAGVSAGIAFAMGVAAGAFGKTADSIIGSLIDMVMGVPHMLLLILISFAAGRGFVGVAVGIMLTHWTSLARLIRAEVLQLKESPYIQIAGKLGVSKWRIVWAHMMPHLLPQLLVGMVLLFPHAILHEASITFLGFGLPPEQPAIGIILSESMKYLSMGKWWLALFPGLLLVFVTMLFHVIGDTLGGLIDPGHAHQ